MSDSSNKKSASDQSSTAKKTPKSKFASKAASKRAQSKKPVRKKNNASTKKVKDKPVSPKQAKQKASGSQSKAALKPTSVGARKAKKANKKAAAPAKKIKSAGNNKSQKVPVKKRQTKHKKIKGSGSMKRMLFRRLFYLMLIAGVAVLAYVLYLDRKVVKKFSGKKWSVPAHVYARPLELYEGLTANPNYIAREARSLGYAEGKKGNGSVSLQGNRLHLHTRGFKFIDGHEPAKELTIRFDGNTIRSIVDASGEDVPLVRMEPLIIGGIYPESNEDRMLVQYSDLPEGMIETLLAVEDRAFFEHYGISIKGIARAFMTNITSKRLQQGGSTLTQQLVKNLYLSSERTIKRKVNEAIMSLLLEFHYSKEEILETYANEIYLGQDRSKGVHGFGLASYYYFNKPIGSLRLHEYALLVGIIKGPSNYNPNRYPKAALERRNQVLEILRLQKLFPEEELAVARNQPLGLRKQDSNLVHVYPAYLDLVRRQLKRDYKDSDLRSNGLKIHTSFDPQVQWQTERVLARRMVRMEKSLPESQRDQLQASIVVVDTETGDVLALVGDKKTQYAGFNRALDAKRPIGSLVKPAVYLAGLMKPEEFTLATVLEDIPVKGLMSAGGRWRPQNFDKKIHGDIMFYRSLALSYNLSTVRLGIDVGLDSVVDVLKKLGIEGDIPEWPSVTLGSLDRSAYDVAKMYQTIAANGFYTPLRSIRDVQASNGEVLKRYPFEVERRFDPSVMYLLQFAMHEVIRGGTAKSVYSKISSRIELAGKTGTSNDQRDSWFAGFSGNRLAVVWVGRDDNVETPYSGGSGALPIWTDLMANMPLRSMDLQEPEGVESHYIDSGNGSRTQAHCPNAIVLPFLEGSAPLERKNCGGRFLTKDEQEEIEREAEKQVEQELLNETAPEISMDELLLEEEMLNDSKKPKKDPEDWVSDMIQ
ncbi:MAG: penicillin-binding protein 1B [Pseudomonadota bacterium]